jgi:hypothetical protein
VDPAGKFGWSELLRGVREEGRHHRTEGAMRERRPKGWSASVGNRAPMNGGSMSGPGCKFGWSELRGVRKEERHHRTEGAMRERRQKAGARASGIARPMNGASAA